MKYLKISFVIVICVLLGISVLFIGALLDIDDVADFKTDYGDTFRIYYDGFKVKTVVTDISNTSNKDPAFHIIVRDKVESKDVVGLVNDDDLKAYIVEDIIFYDEGNGFEIFGSDTKNEKVISLARDNLSSKRFCSIMQKSK